MQPKLRVLSLFAGIGGFDIGLERTGGFETVAFCEIDAFCRKVLAKHWPKVRQYDDVRTLTADALSRDIDNVIKPVSDALVAAGVVTDDSLAEEVSAKWADELGGPAVSILICAAEREMAA